MSVYPSLEDMKVGQVLAAQGDAVQWAQGQAPPPSGLPAYRRVSEEYGYPPPAALPAADQADLASVYPSLMDEYMGLRLEPPTGPLAPPQPLGTPYPSGAVAAMPQPAALQPYGGAGPLVAPSGKPLATAGMVAPLSGGDKGLQRAAVTGAVRQVVLCKDAKGKVGLRLRGVDKGVFVQFVAANSAAALGGLRFGDQILQVDGVNVAGLSGEKAMGLLKKASAQRIVLAVRDRPFERTITLHKDSKACVGFTYRGNKITAIAKDSSAARNGLLIDHHFLEVNGQNVVEMKQKELEEVFAKAGQIVTLTLMPAFVFEHMMSHMAPSLVKKLMDHSVPEC